MQNHSSLKSFPIPLRFILKFSGQSKLGETQLALALTGASRRAFELALPGESFVKVERSFLQSALAEILAAPDSVRRAREALSFSAARFPFSIVVPHAVDCDVATNHRLIKGFCQAIGR